MRRAGATLAGILALLALLPAAVHATPASLPDIEDEVVLEAGGYITKPKGELLAS